MYMRVRKGGDVDDDDEEEALLCISMNQNYFFADGFCHRDEKLFKLI